MKTIIYCHSNSQQTEEGLEAFAVDQVMRFLKESFPGFNVILAKNASEYKAHKTTNKFPITIFNWASYSAPFEFVEKYYSSPDCLLPLIVLFRKLDDDEWTFLKEYKVTEVVRLDLSNKVLLKNAIANLVIELEKPTTLEMKRRILELRIQYYLANNKSEEAQKAFENVKKALSAHEVFYYQAMFLKHEGRFKKGVEILGPIKNKNLRLFNMLGELLFLDGQYMKALHYLAQAAKKSPLNLKRRMMIFRAFKNLSKDDEKYQGRAMQAILDLYKMAPDYEGVKEKIIQMAMSHQLLELLPTMSRLLDQSSSKELKKLFKLIKGLKDPFRKKFVDIYIRSLSVKANKLILEDDHNALTFYKYIQRLLPPDEADRQHSLEYCIARAYFRFGQLEIAKDTVDDLIKKTNGNFEKAMSLRILIEKALKGEFDVLLDDEKDWLNLAS